MSAKGYKPGTRKNIKNPGVTTPSAVGRLNTWEKRARIVWGLFRLTRIVRLKSCPDTKHQSGDSRKLAHSVDLDLSAISEM
jgi:hypothetical protein